MRYMESCFMCEGTGKERFSGATCAFCGGSGYIEEIEWPISHSKNEDKMPERQSLGKNFRLWSTGDEERLIYESADEAIEYYIDDCHPMPIKDIGEVTVYEYKPMDVEKYLSAKNLVEDLLESLEDDYGDPDGDGTKPTERMIEAAEQFIKVIEHEYVPWAMEKTGESVTVDAYEWVKKNAPDWLEEDDEEGSLDIEKSLLEG